MVYLFFLTPNCIQIKLYGVVAEPSPGGVTVHTFTSTCLTVIYMSLEVGIHRTNKHLHLHLHLHLPLLSKVTYKDNIC